MNSDERTGTDIEKTEEKVEEKTFTQTDLDQKISDRLSRERAKQEKLLAELEELKKKSLNSDEIEASLNSLKKERDELQTMKTGFENDLLRYKIAFSTGVKPEYFDLLTGSSEVEIQERAEKIKLLQNEKNEVGFSKQKQYQEQDVSDEFFKNLFNKI